MQRQNSEYKESSARREERFLTPVRSLSANSIRVPPGIDNKLRDVHENRNILKDLLRDIHSKKSASLSLSNEEEQEEESLELTKTESGAIILKFLVIIVLMILTIEEVSLLTVSKLKIVLSTVRNQSKV